MVVLRNVVEVVGGCALRPQVVELHLLPGMKENIGIVMMMVKVIVGIDTIGATVEVGEGLIMIGETGVKDIAVIGMTGVTIMIIEGIITEAVIVTIDKIVTAEIIEQMKEIIGLKVDKKMKRKLVLYLSLKRFLRNQQQIGENLGKELDLNLYVAMRLKEE